MARCIRKVEHEDFYIIYCNTVDMMWAGMYEDITTAQKLIDMHLDDSKLFEKVWNKIKNYQGIIDDKALQEMIMEE